MGHKFRPAYPLSQWGKGVSWDGNVPLDLRAGTVTLKMDNKRLLRGTIIHPVMNDKHQIEKLLWCWLGLNATVYWEVEEDQPRS